MTDAPPELVDDICFSPASAELPLERRGHDEVITSGSRPG
jgi:hypothetical protein